MPLELNYFPFTTHLAIHYLRTPNDAEVWAGWGL